MNLEHLANQGKLCVSLVLRVISVSQALSSQCFVNLVHLVVLQHLFVQCVRQVITVWRDKLCQQFASQAAIVQLDKVIVNIAFLDFIVH